MSLLPPFEQQITQHGGDIAWRRAKVDRVLASFEEAKVIMSIDGIQHCTNVGQHPVYKRFAGTDGNGLKSLFYPHFFVIQAVFVMNGRETGSAIERMYQELSRHWLMDITPDVTFYPRLADPERERQLILGNIRGACVPSERQSNKHKEDKHKEDKHKELSVHLEAAAKLSAEIQDEDEVKQQRTIDFQRMRDKLRLAKQRNLEVEQELQEEIQNRRNTERSKQALQNRLEQRIDQLQYAQAQLQEISHKLVESRQHAKGLQNQLGQMQTFITQHQQISMQISQLETQRNNRSVMMQQCINTMARQSSSRLEGSSAATKRPAAEIAHGEGSKRPRQN
ncbi:hypothetical protein J7337_005137 [Fusarium musae]|uniref:Uncharacterized protein n=1 Tax=Fusarium musae TaxID=1042133 RepID=A0A9P8IQX4_9HYPO|nr:hypothetical protein J7337_005137 [Fusarium musae]KAG9502310.1 hypothetical protein J7337_005137 [Fusarium musae]